MKNSGKTIVRKGKPENLKPFPKGKSGNPKGRPKKLPALDKLMAEVLGEEQNGISAAKAILSKLRQKAKAGDVRAAEILLDRAYGKAKQSYDVSIVKAGKDLADEIYE
jgi:hypothetical protein